MTLLLKVGVNITTRYDLALRVPRGPFRVHKRMNTNIMVLKLVPGFDDRCVLALLELGAFIIAENASSQLWQQWQWQIYGHLGTTATSLTSILTILLFFFFLFFYGSLSKKKSVLHFVFDRHLHYHYQQLHYRALKTTLLHTCSILEKCIIAAEKGQCSWTAKVFARVEHSCSLGARFALTAARSRRSRFSRRFSLD